MVINFRGIYCENCHCRYRLRRSIEAGLGCNTYVHAVGDGAPWIADQVAQQFGAQGQYLIDFYHACEYLAEASSVCEPPDIPNEQAPIRRCHRYFANRRDQLDYAGAIEKGLPIGSGKIESAHRYIVQQRLKRPGAWWGLIGAERMLALQLCRANGGWDA